MAIIRGELGLKGKTLIFALGGLPIPEPEEFTLQELASTSGPSADDLAFLSRMIKLGLERQANMPTPIDTDGFLVPQPYIDPDHETGEGR